MVDHTAVIDDEATAVSTASVEIRGRPASVASERSSDDASCQACGSMHHGAIARQRGWTLQRCSDCGLIFVSPRPTAEQLSAIYSRAIGYYATAEADLSKTSAEPARQLHEHLVDAGVDGRRLLDVGCATGRLAHHMARLGWQTTGIDVNPDAVAVARANGLEVAEGPLETFPFADAFFDVIHMGDVLEHLPRPRAALLAAWRLLRPGGLLVVRVPNADCGFARASLRLARWLGLRWPWSAAPYHLYEFGPAAVSRLLERAGFERTRLESHGRPSFPYALGASGFFDDLKRSMKRRGRYRFHWRLITCLPKLVGVGLLLLPALAYGLLADLYRRTGHRMLATARRPAEGGGPPAGLGVAAKRKETAGREADILGVTFDLLSCEQALETIESWRRCGERQYVTFSNPHSVMMARRDERLAQAFEHAGMTLPDGTGIILAATLLGYRSHGRVTGPSFMLACCDQGRQHGYRHYFCGGGEGVAEALATRLAARFPGVRVVGTCSPPFRELSRREDEALVAQINAAEPDIVWVGLGAPKQERWMATHAGRLDATATIGIGAAFDFHAGTARWAPRWVGRLGIEWAYRLACEPGRMWRRNLDSPLFLLAVLGQWIRRAFGIDAHSLHQDK